MYQNRQQFNTIGKDTLNDYGIPNLIPKQVIPFTVVHCNKRNILLHDFVQDLFDGFDIFHNDFRIFRTVKRS